MNKGIGMGGISAIFGDYNFDEIKQFDEIKSFDEEGKLNEKEGVKEIPLNKIRTNPNQPRKHFDEEALQELADSIRQHGIIQPIVLVRQGNEFVIVAGERRYRASQRAGLSAVPAIVREFTLRQQKEIALIENLQREDLNPIEEAAAFKQLQDDYKITQDDLARAIGKSRPAVANSLRLLTLSRDVIEMVRSNRLSAGHARTLIPIREEEIQLRYAVAAADKKMSVRELENMVNAYLNPDKKVKAIKVPLTPELKELVNNMQRVFATKVKAVGTPNKGRIYIDYYTGDDLQRIYEKIEELRAGQREND